MRSYLAFPLLLASIAAGCAAESDTRTCPPKTTRSLDATDLCARIARGEYVFTGGSLKTAAQGTEPCTVETDFADQYRNANAPDAASDAGAGTSSDGGSLDGAVADSGGADAGRSQVCPAIGRPVTVTCGYECLFGRPFEGFVEAEDAPRSARAFLLKCARAEAASVDAFLILAKELEALGAPADLIAECIRSAEDERVHAKAMSDLAGVALVRIEAPPRPLRSAFEMALENARSGLVFETFAAVLNLVQAERATDLAVRAHFRTIAQDEARHATLSQRLDAFLVGFLTPEERERVAAEQRDAIVHLERAVRTAASFAEADVVGLPSREAQLGLIASLKQQVWAA